MEIIVTLFIGIGFLYFVLICMFLFGFKKIKPYQQFNSESKIGFSVIIPFRNEEDYLPILIKSIDQIQYPRKLFEILFVDDDSSDSSQKIIRELLSKSDLNFQILKNKRKSLSPKKDAIESAIKKSKFQYIITTDADCILPNLWLMMFNDCLVRSSYDMIAAPVRLISNSSFIHNFQALEVLSLQTFTVGGFGLKFPLMVNGANLCFKKSSFLNVNGFEDNNHLATGDDIFLLEKFILHHKEITYLLTKDAMVITHPENNWSGLINQRIRWASKTKNYKLKRAKIIGSLVFAMNFIIVLGIPIVAFGYIKPMLFLFLFGIKCLLDFCSMILQANIEKEYKLFLAYPLSSILYPFLSVWIAMKSMLFSYEWKGRIHKS